LHVYPEIKAITFRPKHWNADFSGLSLVT